MDEKNCYESQILQAHSYLDSGTLRDAFTAYRRLLNTHLRLEAGLGISAVLSKAGKSKSMYKILYKIAAEFPKDHRPYLHLAASELEEGRFIETWKYLQLCLEINSDCAEALILAYSCAAKLTKHEICEAIAHKLIKLDPSNPIFYAKLGEALIRLDKPFDACKAYEKAFEHDSSDIVFFINSRLPFCRIARAGMSSFMMATKIHSVSHEISQSFKAGKKWKLRSDSALTNSIFYTAYSPFNLKVIYEPYLSALHHVARPIIDSAIHESSDMLALLNPIRTKSCSLINQKTSCVNAKVRLGIISQKFYSHSNSQAFEGFFKFLNRDRFTVVLIHGCGTRIDPVHAKLNRLADEIVYLGSSLAHTHFVLSSLDLDILFFTDIGMDPFDFMIPSLRACSIQLSGWGLPHTTGLKTIDYYLSSKLLETSSHVDEYTENLVLLDGLPCCFLSESLHYHKRPKHYFMLPNDRIVIGCVQTLIKIHPDMDLIIEQIATSLPDALFAFVTISDHLDIAFLSRFAKRAPAAFQRTMILERCASPDYLALCDCFDIILDTPYYGAGVTAYMSAYVGTPMVCFSGKRLRDSTTAAIYRYLEIENAPIANSIDEYINLTCRLASDFDLRLQIKKDTVQAAHLLYDNKDYIRSFEAFCLDLLGYAS